MNKFKKITRPTSFSESNINDIDIFNNDSIYKEFLPKLSNNTIKNEMSINSSDIKSNMYLIKEENEEFNEIIIPKNFNYIEICINKLLLFLTHLFLISMFELIFYFKFVTKYEDQAIINVFSSITNAATQSCSKLNPEDKQIIINIINFFMNGTQLEIANNQYYQSRINYNNSLFLLALNIFIGLLTFNFIIFLSSYCYYKRILKIKDIIIDNIIMISILGIYEFIFFSYIVFKYQTTSTQELSYDIYKNIITNC